MYLLDHYRYPSTPQFAVRRPTWMKRSFHTLLAALPLFFVMYSDSCAALPIPPDSIQAINLGVRTIAMAASPDGKLIFAANLDGSIYIIDGKTYKVTDNIMFVGVPQNIVASSDDNRAFVTIDSAQGYRVVNVLMDALGPVIGQENCISPGSIAITPDNLRVLTTSPDSNRRSSNLFISDATLGINLASVPLGPGAGAITVSPDGSKAYIANHYDFTNLHSKTVSIVDLRTYKLVATVTCGNSPSSLALIPSGSKLYIANRDDGTVSVLDTTTNQVTSTVSVSKSPTSIMASPDGKCVYVVTDQGDIYTIATANDTVSDCVSLGKQVGPAIITPDGKELLVVDDDANTISVIHTSQLVSNAAK